MSLTKRQRQRVVQMVQPLVDDAISQAVETQLRSVTTRGGGGTNYLDQILEGQAGVVRGAAASRRRLSGAARTFARLGLVQALSNGDRQTALEMAHTLDIEDECEKAMSAGSGASGGFLLNDDQAFDIIELLRPVSVMRRIGALEIEIPRGSLRTPRIDVGVTAGYVAENQAIPAKDLTTGAVNLSAKKLATLVVLSNELLEFGKDIDVDGIVLTDMLAAMGQEEDDKFLFGIGAVAAPIGITVAVDAANKFDANSTVNLTNVTTDLRTAEEKLLSANVPMGRPVWIISPRTRLFLRDIRDTEDRGPFKDEINNRRTINGIPFFETNNVPNNLGGGGDESNIILADASQVMLGDVAQVGIDRSNQATVNIGGTDTSLYETDRSAIRVRSWNDVVLRHDLAVAVIEAAIWV